MIIDTNKFHRSPQMIERGLILAVADTFFIVISAAMGLWVRFDFALGNIPQEYLDSMLSCLLPNIIFSLIIFYIAGLYRSLWLYASIRELFSILEGCLVATLLYYAMIEISGSHVPASFPVIYAFFLIFLTSCSRFGYRLCRYIVHHRLGIFPQDTAVIRTMLIGAGDAGAILMREISNSDLLNQEVVCVIDDDPKKLGTSIRGVRIVGNRDYIAEAVKKYNISEIIFAIPTAGSKERKEILSICQETGCKVKVLPGIYQMVNEEIKMSMLKEVQLEDLLGREPIRTDVASVAEYVHDRVVLVTGGGGSIGSEICRQVAAQKPKQLIVVDIYENNAYDLQMELNRKFPELNLVVLIASVRDHRRLHAIFGKYHPELVFHAAAHKHVPLMENSPNEAIKNNVMGTFNVAREADYFGVKKMILISTDKAVRPTNIMGASKRICEMIIQEYSQKSKTEFAAVRFGNVLGSNGSVIPLFRRQISEGGPVTVTHREIVRFFMTIPEAVSLVLQAGAFARGGEIFILDMGEPVKIYDMAEKMIRLSGHTPGKDIQIVISGLRPGEKLYEELLIDPKHQIKTSNSKIFVCQQEPVNITNLKDHMRKLDVAANSETDHIREMVRELVPEYREAGAVNEEARKKREAEQKAEADF